MQERHLSAIRLNPFKGWFSLVTKSTYHRVKIKHQSRKGSHNYKLDGIGVITIFYSSDSAYDVENQIKQEWKDKPVTVLVHVHAL